jgi:hypothetical protein
METRTGCSTFSFLFLTFYYGRFQGNIAVKLQSSTRVGCTLRYRWSVIDWKKSPGNIGRPYKSRQIRTESFSSL